VPPAGGCRTAPAGRLDRHRLAVTWTAVAAPWGYALTRVLWALDVPVGVPQAFLDHLNAANPGSRTRILELVLAGFAAGGALLTAGLTRPWSEVFPRWVPGLAGRPVPRALPVGFAGLVAFELTAFGVSLLPGAVAFYAGDRVVAGYRMGLLYPLPSFAILVWGIALGLAAVAFARRRRPPCRACGTPPGPMNEPEPMPEPGPAPGLSRPRPRGGSPGARATARPPGAG